MNGTSFTLFLLGRLLSGERKEFFESIRNFGYQYMQVRARATERVGGKLHSYWESGVLVCGRHRASEVGSWDLEEWTLCLASRLGIEYILHCDGQCALLSASDAEFGNVIARFENFDTGAMHLYTNLRRGYDCWLESLSSVSPTNLLDSRGRKARGELVGIDAASTEHRFRNLINGITQA